MAKTSSKYGARGKVKPNAELRQSQLLTTYGPGSLVDLRRCWVLEQDAVHFWILIERVNLSQQLLGRGFGAELDRYRLHADSATRIPFHFDVGCRCRISANQNGCEYRCLAGSLFDESDSLTQFALSLCGNGFAV